jgi:hypothetical protein
MDQAEFEELLAQWQELDRQALEAEARLKPVGQLSASPEVAAWARDAFEKRRKADACLLRLLRARRSSPPSPDED